VMEASATTVLWRLYKPFGSLRENTQLAQGRPAGGGHVRAVILPGGPPVTLAFLANDQMDRAENYDTMELALFRADEIKRSLLQDGWKEDD
jgi:hypothetical protein